mmetsp:Transcript_3008/g.5387  ORF Transcript_3008/g.5387 Transcript_3008/m.5387 type:complete len:763 (+) Transcript_3008:116-2404(+)
MTAAMTPRGGTDFRTPRTKAFGSAASVMVGGRNNSRDLNGTSSRNNSNDLTYGSALGARPDSSSIGFKPGSSASGRPRPSPLKSGDPTSPSATGNLSLVRAMKGMPTSVTGESEGKPARGLSADHGWSDGEDSQGDGSQSVCSVRSNRSDVSALSTMSSSHRSNTRKGSAASAGSNRSIHMSFSGGGDSVHGDCSIDIEQQSSLDPSKMSLCHDFRQLVGEGQADGLLQCLQMYGYTQPNKLQAHALPAVLHFLGRSLEGGQASHSGKGKSCMMIQGPEKSGKTSSVIISLLSQFDLSLAQPQAILLSASPKRDFDKFLSVFTLMQSINYQSFSEEDDAEIGESSPKVKAAAKAHILIGHPRPMLKLLSSAPRLNLDAVKALIIDDAEELLYNTDSCASPTSAAVKAAVAGQLLSSSATASPPHDPPVTARESRSRQGSKENRLKVLSARDGVSAKESAIRADREASAPESKTLSSCLQSPLVEDIVQICNVIECRQYSHPSTDSFRISAGQAPANKLRYIILSQQLTDPSSRKVLRLLKNSLMKKKNLLGMDGMPPPTRIIKAMKHYYAEAPASDWVRVFAGLVQSLMFPRALIFCDDEGISTYAKEMQDMGIAVSVNMPAAGSTGDAASVSEARRKAVQDFTSNKTQFLLTRSEPAVCQIVLPKVSCVFHFGIPSHLPSVYGVRLLPLDPGTAKDAASILFIDAPRNVTGKTNKLAKDVGKLFDIDFLDMPFEFLPAQTPGPGRRKKRQSGQSTNSTSGA